MKRFVAFVLLGCACLLLVGCKGGKQPFSDLKAQDISGVTVTLRPPDESFVITDEQSISTLADILREVTTYEEDSSFSQYAGQWVEFKLAMADDSIKTVAAYNPFIIIDGVGYKTEYEACEKLNAFGNGLSTKTAGETNGQSLDSSAPPRFAIELADLPEQYSSEEAAANGDYVNVHGRVRNEEKMTAFLDSVAAKKSVALRTVNYTIEGDPIVADIVFDGSKFSIWNDTTRDAFGQGQVSQSEYRNMLEYESEGTTYVFLTNEAEITKELFENGFDGYLLFWKKAP